MTTKLSQKEAVFSATMSALETLGIDFPTGTNIGDIVKVNKNVRSQVCETVLQGMTEGTVELKAAYSPEEMKSYVAGLVNNWFRKDTRLNGGSKYKAKNPGSRAGAGDEKLKNLKALRAQLVAASKPEAMIAQVDQAIETRKSEIAASKVKTVEVNIDAIDDPELKAIAESLVA